MENWRKRWERFMFTEDMIVGGGTVLNPKPETYSDFVRMLDDIENFISQELDKAREEGYEQCKKDFIGNFCDVADRPLVISKSAVKEMFRVLEYGKNLWADNLKTKEDEK